MPDPMDWTQRRLLRLGEHGRGEVSEDDLRVTYLGLSFLGRLGDHYVDIFRNGLDLMLKYSWVKPSVTTTFSSRRTLIINFIFGSYCRQSREKG